MNFQNLAEKVLHTLFFFFRGGGGLRIDSLVLITCLNKKMIAKQVKSEQLY